MEGHPIGHFTRSCAFDGRGFNDGNLYGALRRLYPEIFSHGRNATWLHSFFDGCSRCIQHFKVKTNKSEAAFKAAA